MHDWLSGKLAGPGGTPDTNSGTSRPPTTEVSPSDPTGLLCEVETPKETGTWDTGPQPTGGIAGINISRSRSSDETSAKGTSFSETRGSVEAGTGASFRIQAFKASDECIWPFPSPPLVQ